MSSWIALLNVGSALHFCRAISQVVLFLRQAPTDMREYQSKDVDASQNTCFQKQHERLELIISFVS